MHRFTWMNGENLRKLRAEGAQAAKSNQDGAA